MTAFIESLSTRQLIPPYQARGVAVQGVLIPISRGAIQRYCDRFFNIAPDADFHYAPLEGCDFGMLCVSHYPSIYSTWGGEEKAEGSDHLSQNEMFAVVPVHRYRKSRANLLTDPVVEWIQPLMVLDNATSAFSGREVLGVEALHGDFDGTLGPTEKGYTANISAPTWRTFKPNTAQETLPFLRLWQGTPLAPDELLAQIPRLTELWASIDKAVAIPDANELFPARDMQLVVLKQYRDAGDPLKAIYQALVRARCSYSNMRDMALYSGEDVSLQYSPSEMMDQVMQRFLDQKGLSFRTGRDKGGRRLPLKLEVLFGFSFVADQHVTALETQHEF